HRDLDFPEGHVATSLYAAPSGDRMATIERTRVGDDPEPRWHVALWDTRSAEAPLALLEVPEAPATPAQGQGRPQGRGPEFGRPPDLPPLVAFSPDGKVLATASRTGDSTVISLWPAGTGQPLRGRDRTRRRIAPKPQVFALAVGPDGLVATVGGGGLQLWDPTPLSALTRLSTHLSPIRHLRFDHNGMLAVAGLSSQ